MFLNTLVISFAHTGCCFHISFSEIELIVHCGKPSLLAGYVERSITLCEVYAPMLGNEGHGKEGWKNLRGCRLLQSGGRLPQGPLDRQPDAGQHTWNTHKESQTHRQTAIPSTWRLAHICFNERPWYHGPKKVALCQRELYDRLYESYMALFTLGFSEHPVSAISCWLTVLRCLVSAIF